MTNTIDNSATSLNFNIAGKPIPKFDIGTPAEHKKENEGIDISSEIEVSKYTGDDLDLPKFSNSIYESLPTILQNCVSIADNDTDRDLLLLGSLTAISSVLPNYYTIYGKAKKYFPNLNINIIADFGSGKGVADPCKSLLFDIKKGLKASEKGLFISSNSSSSAFNKKLENNEGRGLIWDTEGVDLALAASQDWGSQLVTIILKAAEHETITQDRKEVEHYIEKPQLSSFLSFVPSNVGSFITTKNGMFSRMLFYLFEGKIEKIDLFKRYEGKSAEHHFLKNSKPITELFTYLNGFTPIESDENNDVGIEFLIPYNLQNEWSECVYQTRLEHKTDKMKDGIMKRLYLQRIRIAMILSILRAWENRDVAEGMTSNLGKTIECTPTDYLIAQSIIETLCTHSFKMYDLLPKTEKQSFKTKLKPNSKMEFFFNALPDKFTTAAAHEKGKEHNIPIPTANRYIAAYKEFGLIDGRHGFHFKK